MRRHRPLFLLSFLATAGLATAQMAGQYTISPTGSGTRNFKTFLEASKALFVVGVSAPVTLFVSPGTYVESFFLLPVTGASATNTMKFFTPLPGSVKLQGSPADTITFISGLSWFVTAFYSFDGFEFVSAPGYAVRGGTYDQDIEFTNCTFQPANLSTVFPQAMVYVEGGSTALRWKFHHNTITFPGSPTTSRYGFYLSQVGQFEIHTNDIDLNNVGNGLYFINLNDARNRIYNNLIHGTLYNNAQSTAINVALSNLNNDIAHNTFVVTTGSNGGTLITTFGLQGQNLNRIYGNILGLIGTGNCIWVNQTGTLGFWESDGNLFFAPSGDVGRLGSPGTVYTTLPAWQVATSKDGSSIAGDPQFVSGTDFHVKPTSPVKDAAVKTPPFVTMDYDGRLRDAKPDMGAYELSGFGIFGKGCAGTGTAVPAIGSTGTVAIGSPSFAVTIAQGLGGAPALLDIGYSSTSWGPVPLPFDIGGGCSILVAPILLLATALNGSGGGNGSASISLPIPNDPSLAGASVLFQWFVLDLQSGSPYGITTSNGGAAQL